MMLDIEMVLLFQYFPPPTKKKKKEEEEEKLLEGDLELCIVISFYCVNLSCCE